MRRPLRILLLPALLVLQFSGSASLTPPVKQKTASFSENKGQIRDQNKALRSDILFSGFNGQLAYHFKRNGLSYQQFRVDTWKWIENPKTKSKTKVPDQTTIYRTDLEWLNTKQGVILSAGKKLEGLTNYRINNLSAITSVNEYEELTYENIYEGINIKWYHKNEQLKYDYLLQAGADYKQIKLQVKGLSTLSINKNGELVMETPLGQIIEQAPYVTQAGRQLYAKWKIENNEISFEIKNVNPDLPMVIDPAVRQWGTYYGGNGMEWGEACVTDASGNVYLAGRASSSGGTTIATSGIHQSTIGGSDDAFLAKFNSAGVRLWATYFGGSGFDLGYNCKVDNSGNVYITGQSTSTGTAMATAGAHQTTNGGNYDAFLAKFNSSGSLIWSTLYGGSGDDTGMDCAVDASGNVFMCGSTQSGSGTVIATSGSHQDAIGGSYNAFLVKFNSSGVRQWATYYGGGGQTNAEGCAVDNSGNVFLAGYADTDASTIVITPGAHQTAFAGSMEGFLVQFNSSGVRQWGTYYGGTGIDVVRFCSADGSGNVYIGGFTNSAGGIATGGSHQSTIDAFSTDAFFAKFNNSGVRQWSTYYGGVGSEEFLSCVIDGSSNVFVAGTTGSPTSSVIATHPAQQYTFGGGTTDAMLLKLNSSGVRQWATYYGGSGQDEGRSVALDGSGNIYLAGRTVSGTDISTLGSHQPIYGGSGNTDAYLIGFKECDITSLTASASSQILCVNENLNLSGSATSGLSLTYSWSGPNAFSSSLQNPSISGITLTGSGTYTFTIDGGSGCIMSTNVTVLVETPPTLSVSSGSICLGEPFTITPSGASNYTISGGSFVVSPLSTAAYTITGSSANNCPASNTVVATVTVVTVSTLSISASATVVCPGVTTTLTGSGVSSYTWSGGPTTAAYAVSPLTNTNYTLTGTAANGCTASAVQSVSVFTPPTLTITPSSTVICTGKTATLTGSGASTYTWVAGPVNATYTVNPLSNSNYTLLATAANGCTNSAVQSVSVNTTPVLTITPSSTVICSGLNATLTATGALSYTWSGGPSTATYVVSPVSTTNYTLTATAANTCSNNAIQSVSVIASPVLTITPSSTVICTGKTATLTGSGAVSYTWTAGPVSATYTVNPLTTSSYTLTGSAGNGCTNTAVQSMSVNTTPVLTITPSSTLICSGKTATLVGSGATTYTWNGGPTNATYTVNPVLSTNYTLTATAANSCSNFAVQSLSVNTTPVLTITPSSTVICTGKTATLTGSGANTFTWSGGPSSAVYTVNPLSNTAYTITGTALNACTNTAVQTISVNTTPVLTITPSTTLICSGQTATFTASGANTYTWTSGPAAANYEVSPIVNTSYTVFGTAINTCTNFASQTLSVNTTPVITIMPSSSVICSGNSSTLTGNGANTFTWNGGPNTTTFQVSPLLTTNYTLSGTALNGCTNSAVQILSVNATPTLNISPSNTLFCLGKVLTLTAGGATTYTWSGGPAASAYTVSPATNTNYTVTGTAPGNCTNTTSYSVDVNIPPTLSITPSSTVICSGKTSTLSASGANTYTWAAGPATTVYVVSPMLNTTFTAIGTAVNGCTNFAVQSISVNASPNITITPSNSLVCSWTTATLTGSGANTYTWTGGPSSPVYTISPFSSVNYTLTGTAVNGCTNDAVQIITVVPSPTLNITPSSSVICSGNTATLTGSGAVTYTWTGGPVNSIYLVSPATTTNYILYGTAANTCTGSVVKTISVNATPGLTVLPSSTVICQGSIATLTAQGAATFTWIGGAAASVNTVSPVSTTNFTVIGETNNCTNTAVQSISVNVSPTLIIVPNNTVICSGNTLVLSASGAMTYTWEAGPSTSTFAVSPLITTDYTLNGTTAAGGNCSTSAVVTVSVNTTPTLSVNSGSICSGNSFVIVPSGASNYTFSGGSATVSPMTNSNYTVIGTSAEGCPAANSVISQVTVYITPTVSVNSGSICSGNSFTIQPSGANTYTITGSLTVVSPSVSSSYSVIGTSSMGCVSNNTAVSDLTVYITPTVSASNGTICSGESFTITPSGAVTYTYNSGLNVVAPLVNTNYSVSGSSAEGCVSSNTAVVSVSVNITPTITVNSGNLCLGDTFTIVPGGALTYTISGGSNTVNPIVNTSYSVSGTNLVGCTSASPAISSVSVIPNPTVTVNSGSLCTGDSFTLQAGGASTYSWSSGATGSSLVITPTVSTTYTVTGTSGNTCSNFAISSITVQAQVVASITPSSMFFCFGNSLTLTASGAPNYTWSNASQSTSIVVSPAINTNYSLIASTGIGGCSNTAAYVVTVNPSPTVSISGASLSCAGYQNTLSAGGALSYTWNNGTMAQFIVVNPTITTNYNVVGVNFQGCTDTAYYQLNTNSPATPSLCLVTVDSLSNYNEVYWDKSLFPEADTFIVYRESSASIYTPIAHIPKNAFSAYVDTNRSIGPITGDPNISLHRYKLQYVDTCGNLSPLSAYHESIKITDNLTGNFNWNYYAIEGVGPLQTLNYVLTRRNIVSGVTFTIGVAAGNQLSDPQYATLSATGNMKWFVYADGFSCNPSLKVSETAAVKSRTKSNSSNERQFPTGIDKHYSLLNTLKLFPNPANETLWLESSDELEYLNLTITDLAGRTFYESAYSGGKQQIDTRALTNGLYFLSVSLDGKPRASYKVIIQH